MDQLILTEMELFFSKGSVGTTELFLDVECDVSLVKVSFIKKISLFISTKYLNSINIAKYELATTGYCVFKLIS